jgi:hypothetical protein
VTPDDITPENLYEDHYDDPRAAVLDFIADYWIELHEYREDTIARLWRLIDKVYGP